MSRQRVIVVDENDHSRKKVVQEIADHGFEAYSAGDGIDALRQIYDVMPQAVVFDAAVPDRSGFKFISFVKRRFPEIGIIVLTEALSQSQQTSIEADIVVPKNAGEPIGFIGALEQLLSRRTLKSQNQEPGCA